MWVWVFVPLTDDCLVSSRLPHGRTWSFSPIEKAHVITSPSPSVSFSAATAAAEAASSSPSSPSPSSPSSSSRPQQTPSSSPRVCAFVPSSSVAAMAYAAVRPPPTDGRAGDDDDGGGTDLKNGDMDDDDDNNDDNYDDDDDEDNYDDDDDDYEDGHEDGDGRTLNSGAATTGTIQEEALPPERSTPNAATATAAAPTTAGKSGTPTAVRARNLSPVTKERKGGGGLGGGNSSDSSRSRSSRSSSGKSPEDEQLLRTALHRSPYFTCLDEEQIETFVREAKLRTFRAGQAVILEGCRDHDDGNDNGNDNDDDQVEFEGEAAKQSASTPPSSPGGTIRNDQPAREGLTKDDDFARLVLEDDWEDSEDDADGLSLFAGAGGLQETSRGLRPQDQQEGTTGVPPTSPDGGQDDPRRRLAPPIPPMSGSTSHLYIVRAGNADVFYYSGINPASLGPGTLFGEGGFLFGRPHSASIVAASDPLECYVMDYGTFVDKVLPSDNMRQLFRRYATTIAETGDGDGVDNATSDGDVNNGDETENERIRDSAYVMTMADFLRSLQSAGPGRDVGAGGLMSISSAYQSMIRPSSSFSSLSSSSSSVAAATAQKDPTTANVSLQDFCFFHLLFARPDPEVDIAFLLMDRNRTGAITRDDFERYLTTLPYFFDSQSEFTERYFGHGQTIRTHQFSQFLAELQREMGRQAFLYRASPPQQQQHQQQQKDDHNHRTPRRQQYAGYLPPDEFVDVLKTTCGWRLPEGILDRLEALYCKQSIESAELTALTSVRAGAIKGDSPKEVADYSRRSVLADLERHRNKLGTRYFAYVDFVAFQDVLVQLPGICNLIERACRIKNGPVSADDLKVASRVFGLGGRLSRQQVGIIFDLFDLDGDGYITTEDAISVCGLDGGSNSLKAVEGRDGKFTFAPPPNYPRGRNTPHVQDMNETPHLSKSDTPDRAGKKGAPSLEERILDQIFQFGLSAVAGGFGIFSVYPLDLAKTRMMNQRTRPAGTRLYLNSFDCLHKVFRYEGIQGLYRGLLPPLLAVGPEKFIKFTVNDLLRGVSSKEGSTSHHWLTEIASGGCAGACQLLVTNPLEITKIRMQMQGDTARLFREKGFPVPKGLGLGYMTFSEVMANLGMSGLYKGAAACLLRDIPFGAIYFPTYAACLDYLVNRQDAPGRPSAANILASGTLAAIPASLLTTPMDFVKTRLQVVPRPGEVMYTAIDDCIRKVYQTEGPSAFFKGSLFRVCRLAPQFGISLLGYEKLSQMVGFKGSAPPTNVPVNPYDYRTAFSNTSNALESKAEDIDNLIKNMGLNPQNDDGRPPKPPLFPKR